MTLTLAVTYPQFLDDLAHKSLLRPSTLRAYRYELAATVQDSRFQIPLQALQLNMIEEWIGRDRPAASTAAGEQLRLTVSSNGRFSKDFVSAIR